ncbi:MAG: hypothetical protein HFJ36_06085 [Clostridia bacterium]|nr:hypothetical protein [Clostridia bacterium]
MRHFRPVPNVSKGETMKVTLSEEKVFNKKQIAIYATIIVICIISIIIAFYVQFYARIDIFGVEPESQIGKKTEEQIEELHAGFDQIFTNNIEIEEGESQDNKKIEADKPLVYTKTEKKENKLNNYDIDVHIPYINIDNKIVEKYNKEIEAFESKINSVLGSKNKNSIYTVEYVSNVQNGILSLMIRSNLKEGNNIQRVILKTYNYDLRNNKEISLEEVLRIENIEKTALQQKIKNEISAEQKKVEDLKALGYNIYSRDVESIKYNIENSKVFYLTDNALYIMYAYGNETLTNEMDLIVI